MGLSSTHMRSLRHTWQSAVSHVFNITGEPVNFICSIIDDSPVDLCIIHRQIKFLQNIMRYFDGNMLLKTVFMYAGRNELFSYFAPFYNKTFFNFNISL